jgi:SAM-dependent methyltransferase
MNTLSRSALADLTFEITWEKDGILHSDRYFVDHLNCWRDIFPGSPLEILFERNIDQPITLQINPGDIIPDHCEKKVIELPRNRLNSDGVLNSIGFGKFYPQGMISGHAGIFKGNMTPFRCVGEDRDFITVDLNHPMAGIPFILKIRVLEQGIKTNERGGSCMDWVDLALTGPGMQTRQNRRPSDFFSQGSFDKKDMGPDSDFYAIDRFVPHIDSLAGQNLAIMYQNFIHPGDKVLDLMAGWESHLLDDLRPLSVHGVGLNASELTSNPALKTHTVQDLNTTPCLAFDDHEFDCVICSLSVEYLTDPNRIFKEVARVLKPGGTFMVSFSNRWFPEKAIRIWENLHDFERMGLVTEYFLESGCYKEISTISSRGYPRPHTDDYFPRLMLSDPLYAVIGRTGN